MAFCIILCFLSVYLCSRSIFTHEQKAAANKQKAFLTALYFKGSKIHNIFVWLKTNVCMKCHLKKIICPIFRGEEHFVLLWVIAVLFWP